MLTYEADQRHADLLMAAYGLNASSKGKAIPWDKAACSASTDRTIFLDEKRRVEFRSNCMRCFYLALDRPDIQFTAKEISPAMASPTVHADETLNALSRYLAGHPRVLWRYPRQEWTGKVWWLTDSKWAACPVTRNSCWENILSSQPSQHRRFLACQAGKRSFTELCGVLVERWG